MLDYTVFYQNTSDRCVILLLYVDDMIITGNDDKGIQQLKQIHHAPFDTKDQSIPCYFLSIEVAYSPKGWFLTQQKYIRNIFSRSALMTPNRLKHQWK